MHDMVIPNFLCLMLLIVDVSFSKGDGSESKIVQHKLQRTTEQSFATSGRNRGDNSEDGTQRTFTPLPRERLRRYARRLGLTEVFCQASSVSQCPVVFGGTEWILDVDQVSANEIPKGSKWYVVMEGATSFCSSVKKRYCPALPGSDGWIMLPPDFNIFCRSKNGVICSRSNNRTWHRITYLFTPTTGTPQVSTTEDSIAPLEATEKVERHETVVTFTANFERVKPEALPNIESITTAATTAATLTDDVEKTINTIRDRKSESSNKNPNRTVPTKGSNMGKRWVMISGNATVYCTFVEEPKCPHIEDNAGKDCWKEEDRVGQLRSADTPHTALLVGETPCLCEAPTLEECSGLSNIFHAPMGNHYKSKDAIEQNITLWARDLEEATIYCTSKQKEKCPIIKTKDAQGDWRLIYTTGYPESGFVTTLSEITILCSANMIKQCPILFETTPWSSNKEKLADSGNKHRKNEKFHCNPSNKQKCPKLKGRGSDVNWAPKDTGKGHSDIRVEEVGTKFLCNIHTNEGCSNVSKTTQTKAGMTDGPISPLELKPKSNICGTNEKNETIVCTSAAGQSFQVKKGLGGSAHWKPLHKRGPSLNMKLSKEISDKNKNPLEDIKRTGREKQKIWLTNVGKAKISCGSLDRDKCPKLEGLGEGLDWKVGNREDLSNFKFEMLLGEAPVLCKADRIGLCPVLSTTNQWYPIVASDGEQQRNDASKVFVTKTGKVKIYCRAQNEGECPRIGGTTGNWEPNSGSLEEVKFGMLLGETSVLCSADTANQCPIISQTSRWHPVVKSPETITRRRNRDDKLQHPTKKIDPDVSEPKKKSMWMNQNGQSRVYCDAVTSPLCPHISGGVGWTQVGVASGLPKKAEWIVQSGSSSVFCDATEVNKCPTIRGSSRWRRMENEKSKGEKKGPHQPSNMHDGVYKPTKERLGLLPGTKKGIQSLKNGRNPLIERTTRGTTRTSLGTTRSYLETTTMDHGGKENHGNVGDAHRASTFFLKRTGNSNVFCDSMTVKDCSLVVPGDWEPFVGKDIPAHVNWALDAGNKTLYCDGSRSDDCPKIQGNQGWTFVGSFEVGRWVERLGDTNIYCDVKNDSTDCPRISKTDWSFLHAVVPIDKLPEDSRWIAVAGTAKLYCSSPEMEVCNRLWAARWTSTVKTGRRIVCDARDVKECPVIIERGRWVRLVHIVENESPPEGSKWTMRINGSKIHCSSQNIANCPRVIGDTLWKKLP